LHSYEILKVVIKSTRIKLIVEFIKGDNKVAERAQEYHRQIYQAIEPIVKVMKEGVNFICGDGNRRLCFPRLAAFMGDYEEAWRACGVVAGHCVKCVIPSFRNHSREHEFDADVERDRHDARTAEEAIRLRAEYQKEPSGPKLLALNRKGYHQVNLFTDPIPFPKCSIYDVFAPDLLHVRQIETLIFGIFV